MKNRFVRLTIQLFAFAITLTFGMVIYKIVINGAVRKNTAQIKTAIPDTQKLSSPVAVEEMEHAWNAAYAYTFCYPQSFKYINEEEVSDTVVNSAFAKTKLISQDGRATLLLWAFDTKDRVTYKSTEPEKQAKIKKYLEQLLGKNEYLENAIITDKQTNLAQRGNKYFILKGTKDTKTFVWKIELSEWPISGDYIFKSMLFEYERTDENIYRQIAQEATKEFGMNF